MRSPAPGAVEQGTVAMSADIGWNVILPVYIPGGVFVNPCAHMGPRFASRSRSAMAYTAVTVGLLCPMAR